MMSKILFLALIGCAVVLAAPAEKPADSEVTDISEEEATEIMKHVEEKLNKWYEHIKENINVNDEDFLKTLEEIKKVFDKIFSEQEPENVNESHPIVKRELLADETVDEKKTNTDEINEEAAKEIIKNMKEKFGKMFEDTVKSNVDDEMKDTIEAMKEILDNMLKGKNEEN